MILKRLFLENFLTHKNTQVEFSEKGITVFIGDNGAGKSSIIEGITYGLFGRTERGNIAELISWGRKQAVVRLEFNKGGNDYLVERVITLRGKKASSTGTVFMKKKGQYIPYFQKNISKEIPRLTGITYKTFTTSVLVKQGDIEGLLELSPRERAKVFEEILDMSLYQLIVELVAQKRRELQVSVEALKASIKDKKEIEDRLTEINKEIKTLDKEIKDTSEKLKQKEDELKKLNGEYEFLLKQREENIKNRGKIDSADKLIQSLSRQIKEKEERLKEIQKLEKKLPQLQKQVEQLGALEENLKNLKEKQLLSERLKSLEEKLQLFKEKEKQKKQHQEKAAEYLETEKKLKEIKEKIKQGEKLKGEKAGLHSQLDKIKKQQEELLQKLSLTVQELLKIKNSYLVLKDNPMMVSQFIQNNRERIRSLKTALEEIKEKKGRLKGEGEELNKRLKNLSSIEGVCPTCSRPLEQHTREELIKEIQEELAQKRKEYKKLNEEENMLKENLKKEEKAEELLRKYSELFDRYRELEKQKTELQAKLRVIDSEIGKIEKYYREEKTLENNLEKLKEAFQLFTEAERFLKQTDIENTLKEINTVKEKIKQLSKNIKEEDENLLKEKIKELKQVEKEYINTKNLIDEKEKIKEELQNIKDEINTLQKVINQITPKLIDEAKIDSQIEKLKEKITVIQQEVKDISSQITHLKSQLAKLEGTKEGLEKELEKLISTEENIRQKELRIEKYRKVENALGPSGIQKVIRENALYELPKITNLIFSVFGFPFQQVRFTENFDISLLAPTVEKQDRFVPVSSLSGGQRVALGLALRMAIGRFLSSKANFLILDEPTVHLDQQRRGDLVNILIGMKEKNLVNQLILVTHDTEIEDAADMVYYVDKGTVSPVS